MCLRHLICTVKNVGDKYSTRATNFGVGGIKNSWQPYKKGNFRVGDIVILKEVSNRNEWKLAKVIDVYNDETGQLCVGASESDQ